MKMYQLYAYMLDILNIPKPAPSRKMYDNLKVLNSFFAHQIKTQECT